MKVFIVISCLAACTFAFSDETNVHIVQDTAGNYKLILHDKDISREEEATADGKVVGSYGFADPNGVVHTIKFVADKDGYVAEGADLPVPIEESAVIAKTRAHHQAVVDRWTALLPPLKEVVEEKPVDAKEVLAELVVPEIVTLPGNSVPVEEKEVVDAKAEFLKLYADALLLLKEEYAKL